MRLLHVNAGYGSGGGTESYLALLLGDQQRLGHDVAVLAERVRGVPAGIPVRTLAGIDRHTAPVADDLDERFAGLVAELEPDLIHVHNTLSSALVERAAALRPTVRSIHDHTSFCPGLNKEYADGGLCDRPMGEWCLERFEGEGCLCLRPPTLAGAVRTLIATRRLLAAHRAVGAVLVASRYMRAELERAGLPGDAVALAPYYVDVPESVAEPDRVPPLVASLGRLVEPDKGFGALLEALAGVGVPFHAAIAGDGPDREALARRAGELGLADRVSFPGSLSRAEALALLGRARVVALPSLWNEPFGIVGLEALAAARPVVAFDVGGVRDWLEPERNGLMVARGDARALGSALEALLRDGERARALGVRGARAVRERFTRERHLAALGRAYARAVQRWRRPRP